MKYKNISRNTIFLGDINIHIPYSDGEIMEISSDQILKSNAFQMSIMQGLIEPVEFGDSNIEMFLKRKLDKKKAQSPKNNLLNNDGDSQEATTNGKTAMVRGHVFDQTGYGKVNRNLAKILSQMGYEVNLDSTSSFKLQLTKDELEEIKKFTIGVKNVDLQIDSIIPTFSETRTFGKKRILYTTIEAETVPEYFGDLFQNYHDIWVTSHFCKNVLEKQKIAKNVKVVHPFIDSSLYREDVEPYQFEPSLNKFVFISVFGWSYRKGYDALLRAYFEEFNSRDDVSLLIVSKYQNDPDRSEIIKRDIQEIIEKTDKKDLPHITRYSKLIPEKKMPSIYRACDCFVLPSRGEGFGLCNCEASLCGLPCIATKHSGVLDFMNDDNSFLVEPDEFAPMTPGKMHVHYWDNHVFPKLTSDTFINDLRSQMRYVYENLEDAKKRNKKLQDRLKKEYSAKAISIDIRRAINANIEK
jgi:glycosyltransferase involved in cell wall biosynthesis